MNYCSERARTQTISAEDVIRKAFADHLHTGVLDAVFLHADRRNALGFCGLPYPAPICSYLLNEPAAAALFADRNESALFVREDGRIRFFNEHGEQHLNDDSVSAVQTVYDRILASCGSLNEKGELLLDLKTYPVGPHYPVNLLLGSRAGYPFPLCTTPKSALDSLGRGSFRATGGEQVLATRCVLGLEENGEPANRQFYLVEDGRQIFYSADVHENVKSAHCCHSQNRTVITYETECGLQIRRTIFILPQQPGMPNAVEAQRVEITNHSGRERHLRIVMTGMFGITGPLTIANDVVYANIVMESEIFYEGRTPAAMTLYAKPKDEQGRKRFATMLCEGRTFDEFCTSQSDFIGNGSLAHPDLAAHLPSAYSRKNAPFFAMSAPVAIKAGAAAVIDEFTGMMETEEDVTEPFDAALHTLLARYRDPAALSATFKEVTDFWETYPSYLIPASGDPLFRSYVGYNLPFQVLYQTYVSRAFAWTQKSYREMGFREIQDIYASMYYLSASGKNSLVKELISSWVAQVYRMGYANHDFTFTGKEPGDCSDDQLWLVQAVYRYVMLSGDTAFLNVEYPVAGEENARRPLWQTLMAILTYSGRISVGRHGLPLLDKADWNDTLKLDPEVMKGPEKEKVYRLQLQKNHQEYGAPLENTLCESVMNACLLKIAADEIAQMAVLIHAKEDGKEAEMLSRKTTDSMQKYAWKDGSFARCLINDGRPGGYTYLGAKNDGLSLDPEKDGTYFLNSYSWPILAGIATEEEIRTMLDTVEKNLKTDAGLRLCTLVDFDKLHVSTGTALYFPGDRENGGVFKHAAMMATVASLQAAKTVRDEALAKRLADLAFFMISRTVPYATMQKPFTLKGNPRFCTQYNNSETGENIGPMLSGTASWLTLAVYEFYGIHIEPDAISLDPVLPAGEKEMSYILTLPQTKIHVEIHGDGTRFRTGPDTVCKLDGTVTSRRIAKPAAGEHRITIQL